MGAGTGLRVVAEIVDPSVRERNSAASDVVLSLLPSSGSQVEPAVDYWFDPIVSSEPAST